MASGKRASMREGPLAALFRKTEEDAKQSDAAGDDVSAADHAAAAASRAPEPTPIDEIPPREAPHPSLAHPSEPLEDIEPYIPSPQDRLRSAFSSELPENLLEPSTPAGERERSRHIRAEHDIDDVFARADPGEREMPFGQARPAGQPVIRVVGVGGGGSNAINRMVEAQIAGVEFLAINTDLQSLQESSADITLHIGANLTRGLGSGSNPDLGRAAAMEDYDRIKSLLKGSDMIFVAAGAGGGTGTGAAPIVARIAVELGALTVGIVTKPFGFEGSRRRDQAEDGIQALKDEVDTLIVVPNNRLLSVLDKNTSMVEAFRVADDVLRQGVQGISDLVTLPGVINLDFADVRTIMAQAGNALLGIGMGTGENRAVDAAEKAVSSPLLETSMEGAHSILLSITGGRDLSLWEINEAAKAVSAAAHPDANIIFGAMVDEALEDQVWVTVVATRYGGETQAPRLKEPVGEPRITRGARPPAPSQRQDYRSPRERHRDGGFRAPNELDDYRPAASTPPPAPQPETVTLRRSGGLNVSELDVPEFMPRRF
ncbi:MAG TPA: cell division protein FtsZ [Solirubrobacteraceae bacterium]|jgi:cell division protein FtsZ|nr:cell division protein FtsZ [Solirubrobacteraceae bacterium]